MLELIPRGKQSKENRIESAGAKMKKKRTNGTAVGKRKVNSQERRKKVPRVFSVRIGYSLTL